MNLIKPPTGITKDFNANFDTDHLERLRTHANDLSLDVRDLIRAGAKLILKVDKREQVVKILLTQIPKKNARNKNHNK